MNKNIVSLLIVTFVSQAYATNNWTWDARNELFQVKMENSNIFFQLRTYHAGREFVNKKEIYSKNIRLIYGNVISQSSHLQNIQQSEIYKNGSLLFISRHFIPELSEGLGAHNYMFLMDAFVLPADARNVKINLGLNGEDRQYLIDIKNHVVGDHDITRIVKSKRIKWGKKIPEYKTTAFIHKEDLKEEVYSIGQVGSFVSGTGQSVGRLEVLDLYGRCISGSKAAISSYSIKLKSSKYSPKNSKIISVLVKDKLRYVEFSHRILLPYIVSASEYNLNTRLKVSLECLASNGDKMVDSRFIYLPLRN